MLLIKKNYISHRRKGRGQKHLRIPSTYTLNVVLVDFLRKEEEEALSATLNERIEMQTIIQKLCLSACRVIPEVAVY